LISFLADVVVVVWFGVENAICAEMMRKKNEIALKT
jgi:hypothetical protein